MPLPNNNLAIRPLPRIEGNPAIVTMATTITIAITKFSDIGTFRQGGTLHGRNRDTKQMTYISLINGFPGSELAIMGHTYVFSGHASNGQVRALNRYFSLSLGEF